MTNLTEMTHTVYIFICNHIKTYGYGPTLREIGAACYLRHSSVLRHTDRLEGMGWIARTPGKARSIHLGENAPDVSTLRGTDTQEQGED